MDLIWASVKVLAGAFTLFTIARMAYGRLVPYFGWVWVALLGALAIGNMLVHRWIGSTVNPPFFTALLLGVTLVGISPQSATVAGDISTVSLWFRRGIAAVAMGTVLGWFSYAELVTVASNWLRHPTAFGVG
jgi:hypothetical protein